MGGSGVGVDGVDAGVVTERPLELLLWRAAWWGGAGWLAWQSEVSENALCNGGIEDRRDDSAAASTIRADENVDGENATEQFGPGPRDAQGTAAASAANQRGRPVCAPGGRVFS